MTLAVICWKLRGGGAERVTGLFLAHMQRAGHRVLLLHDEDCGDADLSCESGIERIPLPRLGDGNRSEVLEHALRTTATDICICVDHWRRCFAEDIATAKRSGVKVIAYDHSTFFFPMYVKSYDAIAKRIHDYALADIVVTPSPVNALWWEAVGVKCARFMPNYLTFEAPKSLLPTPEGQVRLLCVGRICRAKQVEKAVEATAELVHTFGHRHITLDILGGYESTSDRRRLKKAIRDFGVANAVNIVGEATDVASYYFGARILLICSMVECSPMILYEAKAYGVPTVMFELPYLSSVSPRDGVLSVPMGDVKAMAAAIHGLLTDRERYNTMRCRAVESLAPYEANLITRRWENLIESLRTGSEALLPENPSLPPQELLHLTMQEVVHVASVHGMWQHETPKCLRKPNWLVRLAVGLERMRYKTHATK